jgi:protein-disulfide isomerase
MADINSSTEYSETPEVDEPQTLRRNLILAISLLVVFLLGLGSGYLVWARPLQDRLLAAEQVIAQGAESAAAQQAAAAANQQNNQEQVRRYDVPIDDDPILGLDSAPITIIEFSDYECPFCRRWHLEVYPQIRAKYGDQVRFVYRDFPLYNIHPNAGPAAEAANCAGDQDRYFEFSELLYSGKKPLNRDTYESYAKDLKLDMNAFVTCVEDERYQQEVEADYAYAGELGVRSTPTFFINGLAVVGAQPFDVFEQIIDMELAGDIP